MRHSTTSLVLIHTRQCFPSNLEHAHFHQILKYKRLTIHLEHSRTVSGEMARQDCRRRAASDRLWQLEVRRCSNYVLFQACCAQMHRTCSWPTVPSPIPVGILRVCRLVQSAERKDSAHAMATELVQGGLEVVEYDAVRKALKHKCELPEGVDNTDRNDWCYRKEIDNDANDAQAHAAEEDAKARGYADDVEETQLILKFDIPEKVANGEYPPRVASRANVRRQKG